MKRLRVVGVILLMVIMIIVIQSPAVTGYTTTLVYHLDMKTKQTDPLYTKIVERAKQLEQPAIEPHIDRVWKLIPGYNGIAVDVDATYKGANHNNGTFTPVIKEIFPQKSVWDLPPNPIYRGNPKKNMVSLMINVAWGNEHLESILKTLAEHNVRATFFLDGSWVAKNPTLARQISDAGHEIGSHAYSHPMMSRLTKDRIIDEIEKTNRIIKDTLGLEVTLFAPPSGDYDHRVVSLAWERKMLTVLWTLDTVDWRNPPVQDMVNKIIKHVNPGKSHLNAPNTCHSRRFT